jgi:hypothetical protein
MMNSTVSEGAYRLRRSRHGQHGHQHPSQRRSRRSSHRGALAAKRAPRAVSNTHRRASWACVTTHQATLACATPMQTSVAEAPREEAERVHTTRLHPPPAPPHLSHALSAAAGCTRRAAATRCAVRPNLHGTAPSPQQSAQRGAPKGRHVLVDPLEQGGEKGCGCVRHGGEVRGLVIQRCVIAAFVHGLASGSSSTRGANPKAYCPKPEHIDMPLGTNNAVLSQC